MMPARAPLACLLFALAACSSEPEAARAPDPLAIDPLIAAALHDPLMSDPDLAHRNEANAAVTMQVSHRLPRIAANEEAALAAREAARLELLEYGRIADLPAPGARALPHGLAEARTAAAMLAAAGAPEECARGLREDFAIAADMPAPARIMPHGMVQQAAGGDGRCGARVVRYLSPAARADAVHYHYNTARLAGLEAELFAPGDTGLEASGAAGRMVVAVREGPGRMSAVDLLWWRP